MSEKGKTVRGTFHVTRRFVFGLRTEGELGDCPAELAEGLQSQGFFTPDAERRRSSRSPAAETVPEASGPAASAEE